MSKSSNKSNKECASDGPRRVLEAQKSSQASSNKKGLQPEIANRIRVSAVMELLILGVLLMLITFFKY